MVDSEYEDVFKRKELHDIYASGEVNPLDDIYLVEDAAVVIRDLNNKLEFYKEYKKKRIEAIANEMKVVQNKIDFFKEIIIATLKSKGEKSVKFPGSCTVTSKNQKAKWSIDDEEEFIAMLQAAQKEGENVDDVLEFIPQYNIKKLEADKLLTDWEKSGKLDSFLQKAKDGKEVISKTAPKTIVSLAFVEKDEKDEDVEEISVPLKFGSKKKVTDDFDTL